MSHDDGSQLTYQACLLHLWRVNTGDGPIWHTSLEDPQTGVRQGFADLTKLLAFLEAETIDHGQTSADETGGTLRS